MGNNDATGEGAVGETTARSDPARGDPAVESAGGASGGHGRGGHGRGGSAARGSIALIAILCAAEILSMSGFAAFPALLPQFLDEWRLTHTAAGWINSVYYGGYLTAVLVLVSLTDRVDPRRIYLLSMVLSVVALGGFALFARGFWSALIFRSLAGVGLAGTYMPGLKILSDLTSGRTQTRAVSFYTSSFGIGSSLSYYASGKAIAWTSWQWTFGLAAAGPLLATILVWSLIPPVPPNPSAGGGATAALRVADFRQVLRNRRAMGYTLAYAAHNWELFGLRSWIVAYLTFAKNHVAGRGLFLTPPTLASLVNLMGLPASVIGNELSLRFGRGRVVGTVMTCSALLACGLGFTASLPGIVVMALFLLYGVTASADSSSITSGAIAEAAAGKQGTTMAVHSAVGFSGAFLGPLAVGIVLDLSGSGGSILSWGLGFITMGAGVAAGPLFLLACLPPKRKQT